MYQVLFWELETQSSVPPSSCAPGRTASGKRIKRWAWSITEEAGSSESLKGQVKCHGQRKSRVTVPGDQGASGRREDVVSAFSVGRLRQEREGGGDCGGRTFPER